MSSPSRQPKSTATKPVNAEQLAFASLTKAELALLRSGITQMLTVNAAQLRAIGVAPISTFSADRLTEHLQNERTQLEELEWKLSYYINALLDR